MERIDALVIGAGLNGLTAAARLSKAGLRVLVLERNDMIGGSAAHHELAPGYSVPALGYTQGHVPAELIREFDLGRRGVQMIRREGGVSLFEDGSYVASYSDGNSMRRELARHGRRDADAWRRFSRDMLRQAAHLKGALLETPNDPALRSIAAVKDMAARAKTAITMNSEDLHDQIRFWSLSVADLLHDYFESDAIVAHFAAQALRGRAQGPYAPTTASLLPGLWFDGAANGGAPWRMTPRGGLGVLTGALADIVRENGGDIRLEAEVTDIRIADKKAAGVTLADGEEIDAAIILSDLDMKRSFLSLFQWSGLPDGFVKEVGSIKTEGIVAKVNYALETLPDFANLPAGIPALAGGLRIGGGLDAMERAYEDWVDNTPPAFPLLDIEIPTLDDPTLAPAGGHIMSVSVQYVPHELHDGVWSKPRREALLKTVGDMISAHAPGFRDVVVAQEIKVPSEIEEMAGHTRGDPFLGQMSLDQMFFNRPIPGFGAYQSPIANFYMCSASTHPGGLAIGAAGANAASEVLKTVKRGRS